MTSWFVKREARQVNPDAILIKGLAMLEGQSPRLWVRGSVLGLSSPALALISGFVCLNVRCLGHLRLRNRVPQTGLLERIHF